jgi:hypothetical protein
LSYGAWVQLAGSAASWRDRTRRVDGNASGGVRFEPVNGTVEWKTGFEPMALSLARRWG